MQETLPQPRAALDDDDARLRSLGYRPQLGRVLGLFADFSVAFTFMAPVIGIFTMFTLGLGTGGPAYLWLTLIPVAGMLLVALVLGELASHYPAAGALYQYAKYTVGRRFGWFVGWFYGIACWSRWPRWTSARLPTPPCSPMTCSDGPSSPPLTGRSWSSRWACWSSRPR